jgi:hypothetical protein
MTRWNKILTIELQEKDTIVTYEKSLLHLGTLSTLTDKVFQLTKSIQKKHNLLHKLSTLQDQIHEVKRDFLQQRHQARKTESRQYNRFHRLQQKTMDQYKPQWRSIPKQPKLDLPQPQPLFKDHQATVYQNTSQ